MVVVVLVVVVVVGVGVVVVVVVVVAAVFGHRGHGRFNRMVDDRNTGLVAASVFTFLVPDSVRFCAFLLFVVSLRPSTIRAKIFVSVTARCLGESLRVGPTGGGVAGV